VSSSGISAVPSGSGLTFLLDSSFEQDDNPQNLIGEDFDDDEDEFGLKALSLKDKGDDEVPGARRERELTDKYLAGKCQFNISFSLN
jgi:hypothetical protein